MLLVEDEPSAARMNVIDVYINRLRRKIDGDGPSFIRTRRGAGYQLIALGGIEQ